MKPILTPSTLRRALNLLQDQAHETGAKTRFFTANEVWQAVKGTRKGTEKISFSVESEEDNG